MILDFLKKLFHVKDKNSSKYKSIDETTKLEVSLPLEKNINEITIENSDVITTENLDKSKFVDSDELPFGASYEFTTQELKSNIQKDIQVIEQTPTNTSNLEEELPFANINSVNTTISTSTSQDIEDENIYTPQVIITEKSTASIEVVEVPFDNTQETISKNDDDILMNTFTEDKIQEELPFGIFTEATDTNDIKSEMVTKKSVENIDAIENFENNITNSDFIVINEIIIHKATKQVVDNQSIDCLKLSVRAYNALRRANINSIKDLLSISLSELKQVKNLGINSINETIKKLNLYLNGKINLENILTEVQICSGNSIIDNEPNITVINREIPIDDLPLSVRAKNGLKQIGIFNSIQLIELENEKLPYIRNIGKKTLSEIVELKKELYENAIKISIKDNLSNEVISYLSEFENEIKQFSIDSCKLYDIKPNLISLIDGTEIDKLSCYDKWYSEVHIQECIKDYILNVCNENHFFGVSLLELKERLLNNTSISEALLDNILEDLKSNKLQQVQENRYILKCPDILEYISNLPKISDQAIFILERRINGETLASISNELNLTRQRVQQIQDKSLNIVRKSLQLERISIKEERFKPFFARYKLSKDLFIMLTEDTPQAYNYLNIATKNGETSIEEILNDKIIPNWIIKNYKKYLKSSINSQFLCVTEDNNRLVKKVRIDIEIYVLSKYCCDECTFDEFINVYQQFLCKYNLENDEKLRITDIERHSQENQLKKSNVVLWKYGKKLRYYNIAERDYTELLQTLNLEQYENIEISTLKFIREYPEVMKKYDIRDEYELHNLLRKIGFGENNSNISFNMPYICFGEFNRNEMVKNFLFELAPVSAEDLADAIFKEYGFQVSTVMSWFKCIQEYYKDGIYSVDYKILPENHMQLLQETLTEDFYYISEIKTIYKNLVPNADITLISSFNLKRMGFIVNSTYVIQHHSSANNYFKYILTNQDIVDISKINSKYNSLMLYYQAIENLRDNYEIIEFEPYQYINIRRLNSMGIDKSNFISYCDAVYNYVEDNSYFTIKFLIDNGFSSNIDFLGFDNCFYSSILKPDRRFSYIRLGGTVLFYKGNKNISQATFLIYLLNSIEKIDLNELLDYILQKYGITLDKFKIKECIKNSSFYYDDIMEKIYNNYEIYLEELNSIDDNTEDCYL